MSSSTPAVEPVRITVVESEACHFCEDADRALEAFAASYPVAVDTLDARSAAGRELIARHRAAMTPLVLLEDAFFSSGRLPRRKLDKLLRDRFGNTGAPLSSAGESHHG